MKRPPAHLVGLAAKRRGHLVALDGTVGEDAVCQRCDDAGVVCGPRGWRTCHCASGDIARRQIAERVSA